MRPLQDYRALRGKPQALQDMRHFHPVGRRALPVLQLCSQDKGKEPEKARGQRRRPVRSKVRLIADCLAYSCYPERLFPRVKADAGVDVNALTDYGRPGVCFLERLAAKRL